jgi:hypothetical protein
MGEMTMIPAEHDARGVFGPGVPLGRRLRLALLLLTLTLGGGLAGAVHGSELEEAIDYYQYTDRDGGVHFVDSPEKIPSRYRGKALVHKETSAARQTTRVRIVDGHIHVPVTLRRGDRALGATLLLDTGASLTTISEELALRLQLDPTSGRPATTRLADGSEVDIRLVEVDALGIGFRKVAPMQIGIMKQVGSRQNHDGLLGLDFLGVFQYQIDIANELIRWQ